MEASSVQCECGAKVRVPAGAGLRAFRCPQCKTPFALTAEAVTLTATTLDAAHEIVCPICQTAIDSAEKCVTCPSCQIVHHHECWAEVGGCGTFACKQAPAIDKSEHTTQAPLTAWGDTKRCPVCGETIKAIALRCRYCQTEFDTVDPMSLTDLHLQMVDGDKLKKVQQSVTALFVVALFGILAPLILLISLIYLLPRRKELAKCGPLYKIMGWTALGLSCVYSLLFLVIALLQ